MATNLRQWWTASNPQMLLESQSRLLGALVGHRHHQRSHPATGGPINWVEFRSKHKSASNAHLVCLYVRRALTDRASRISTDLRTCCPAHGDIGTRFRIRTRLLL